MIVDGANIIVQLMEPGERARLEKRLAKPKRMAFSESVIAAYRRYTEGLGLGRALGKRELQGMTEAHHETCSGHTLRDSYLLPMHLSTGCGNECHQFRRTMERGVREDSRCQSSSRRL
jgi:hypothetical protein